MPELPEIESLVREFRTELTGAVIETIRIFRTEVVKTPSSFLTERVRNQKILEVGRRGKYLCWRLPEQWTLWFHLGMSGQLYWTDRPVEDDPHLHFEIKIQNKSKRIVLRDPRRFGKLFLTNGTQASMPAGIRALGPEPLQIQPADFIRGLKSRTGRIKSLLLNQNLLAGIGNIYADEVLHSAGIHPWRRPFRLSKSRLLRLHESLQTILNQAIAHGGSSTHDYVHSDGRKGGYQAKHQVYGRQGQICYTCGAVIRRKMLSGRSAHFCPSCQK